MIIISLLLLGSLLPHLSFSGVVTFNSIETLLTEKSVHIGVRSSYEKHPTYKPVPGKALQGDIMILKYKSHNHSRPYMVSVQNGGQHLCGGFLVSERLVMTAAHCFEGRKLTVVVGAHDPRQSSDRIAVKFHHIHPGYDSVNVLNDIMILQFNGTTKNRKTAKPISIPNKKRDIKAKSKCSVASWGRQTTNGSPTEHLMEADVTVIDTKACQKIWKEKSSRIVCALHPGGSCQGDSGGPLVCDGTAVGVVSFNQENNCDKPTKPNVYTKISSFLPWIKAILV
ncbi:mast cell protease 4-like [Triplophysa rosa]|uniref:mast cell protease 4-like n=1 Tax=Triplophysa rosa TaxID=992332 RepID=UPI0025460E6F|nr:mast cell protease 4-like [Triplophysa rosa]